MIPPTALLLSKERILLLLDPREDGQVPLSLQLAESRGYRTSRVLVPTMSG